MRDNRPRRVVLASFVVRRTTLHYRLPRLSQLSGPIGMIARASQATFFPIMSDFLIGGSPSP
jgi:hypothetical protein